MTSVQVEITPYHLEDHQAIRRIFREGQLENIQPGVLIGLKSAKIKSFLVLAFLLGFTHSWLHALFCIILVLFIQYFSIWHCYYFYADLAFKTDLKDRELKFWAKPNVMVVAKVNGKVVGCGAYQKLNQDTVEMNRVCVDSKFRGLKIGKTIVENLMNKAKNEGYQVMYLTTSQAQITAQKMYEKLGFSFLRKMDIGFGYGAFLHDNFSGLCELVYIKRL